MVRRVPRWPDCSIAATGQVGERSNKKLQSATPNCIVACCSWREAAEPGAEGPNWFWDEKGKGEGDASAGGEEWAALVLSCEFNVDELWARGRESREGELGWPFFQPALCPDAVCTIIKITEDARSLPMVDEAQIDRVTVSLSMHERENKRAAIADIEKSSSTWPKSKASEMMRSRRSLRQAFLLCYAITLLIAITTLST